jgi:hypothetical protein
MSRKGSEEEEAEAIAVKRGAWTSDEDEKLVSFMQKNHGRHGTWKTLPKLAGIASTSISPLYLSIYLSIYLSLSLSLSVYLSILSVYHILSNLFFNPIGPFLSIQSVVASIPAFNLIDIMI